MCSQAEKKEARGAGDAIRTREEQTRRHRRSERDPPAAAATAAAGPHTQIVKNTFITTIRAAHEALNNVLFVGLQFYGGSSPWACCSLA